MAPWPRRYSGRQLMINTIAESRGEILDVTPRHVGWLLKSVGLHTEKLGKAGRGVCLHPATRDHIHRLAIQYEVRSVDQKRQLCSECEKAFASER
jgi:hypothetical protein